MTARMRVIAGWELRQAVRSRWVAAIALVLAGSSVAVALLGLRSARQLGLSGTGGAAAAMVNLAVLLPPLFALLLGLTSLVARSDRSMVAVVSAQTVPAGRFLVASFVGLAAALWLTLALGFGLSALVLAGAASTGDLASLAAVAGATAATSTACLAVGMAVGALAPSRGQATAVAVAAWFVLTLGMDLVLAGVAPALNLGPTGLLAAVLANPVEAGRILALLGNEAGPSALGPFGGYLHDAFGVASAALLLCAALATWTGGALTVAVIAGRRSEA
jgi:ABC-type transport system involved in multi-copper enzyme maturation permease subunit